MFDKRKDSSSRQSGEHDRTANRSAAEPAPGRPARPPAAAGAAVIGAALVVSGDLAGSEDVVVAGRFEGTINLPTNSLMVANGGRVQANVKANVLQIEGRVTGDVEAGDKVVITATGQMEGNITAPRVILVDGAKFKGRIDMDPAQAPEEPAAVARETQQSAPSTPSPAVKAADATGGKQAGVRG